MRIERCDYDQRAHGRRSEGRQCPGSECRRYEPQRCENEAGIGSGHEPEDENSTAGNDDRKHRAGTPVASAVSLEPSDQRRHNAGEEHERCPDVRIVVARLQPGGAEPVPGSEHDIRVGARPPRPRIVAIICSDHDLSRDAPVDGQASDRERVERVAGEDRLPGHPAPGHDRRHEANEHRRPQDRSGPSALAAAGGRHNQHDDREQSDRAVERSGCRRSCEHRGGRHCGDRIEIVLERVGQVEEPDGDEDERCRVEVRAADGAGRITGDENRRCRYEEHCEPAEEKDGRATSGARSQRAPMSRRSNATRKPPTRWGPAPLSGFWSRNAASSRWASPAASLVCRLARPGRAA